MTVDDEALDLYHTHYNAITNKEAAHSPPVPYTTNSVDLIPTLQQLLIESRDIKTQLLSLNRRVDSIFAGFALPYQAKNQSQQ